MNRYFQAASDGKRILAGFLDFIIVVIFALFLYVPTEAISASAGFNHADVELALTFLYSGLFDFNEENSMIELISNEEAYPKAVYLFYVDKVSPTTGELQRGYSDILVEGNDFNSAEDYYVKVLGKNSDETLFDFDKVISSETPWEVSKKIGVTNEEVKAFYLAEFNKAYDQLSTHPRVLLLARNSNLVAFLKVAIAYVLSAILLIVLLPLLLKQKVTLGKLIAKLSITTSDGYQVSKKQLAFRQIAQLIFSYIFFFLPFHFISLLMSMFGKNKRGLFDYLAKTIVADKNNTIVFTNEIEQLEYRKALGKRLVMVDKMKEERRAEEEKSELNDPKL